MNVQIHPRIKFYSKLHLDWIIKLEGRIEFDKVSSKNEWLARQLEFDIISFFYDIDYIIQHYMIAQLWSLLTRATIYKRD